MKLSTTPDLEGRPSNNQRSPKVGFQDSKKINSFYWNCHAPWGLIFTAAISVRFSLSKPQCLSPSKSFYSLTLASTEILFEIVSLKVYMRDLEGDKGLYRLVLEIHFMPIATPLFHQEVETNQDGVIVIPLSTDVNGNVIIILHHLTL